MIRRQAQWFFQPIRRSGIAWAQMQRWRQGQTIRADAARPFDRKDRLRTMVTGDNPITGFKPSDAQFPIHGHDHRTRTKPGYFRKRQFDRHYPSLPAHGRCFVLLSLSTGFAPDPATRFWKPGKCGLKARLGLPYQ
jgi:hypothetical protein